MSTVPTEAPASRSTDVDLLFHQDDELFDYEHFLLFICGGRGSGKSYTDPLHFLIRSEKCVDQPYAIFANTHVQLLSIVTLLTEHYDFLGIKYIWAKRAPRRWRKRWRRAGIHVPAQRVRNEKFLIAEDGTHILCCTTINNSYTRAKSLDLMFALVEEATEPGVTEAAWDTIIGCVRCGFGSGECKRRGHNHQVVIKFNVPMNDPSHFVFKKHEQLQAKEIARANATPKQKPFYRLISSSTRDNPHTGDYDERLRAAWDAETYEQQTSGRLERNVSQLSYSAFSDQNILPHAAPGIVGLSYSPVRPLHLWFDFNRRPAVAGWGHDLNTSEVPSIYLRTGHEYFGVVGELFSGQDTLLTDAVAQALLDDPSRDAKARCRDCDCEMSHHVGTADRGDICRRCGFHRGEGKATTYCQAGSKPMEKRDKDYIHAPSSWRGLRNHRADIYVYGDASGKAIHADSVAGSSREILRNVFSDALGERVHFRFKEANPPIALRLLAVNRALCAKNGVRSLFFGDWCVEHIADCREVVPGLDGNPKKTQPTAAELKRGGGYWLRTHCMDGLGYERDVRCPAVIPSASGGMPSIGEPQGRGPMATNWRSPT